MVKVNINISLETWYFYNFVSVLFSLFFSLIKYGYLKKEETKKIKDDFSIGDFFDARVFFVDGSYLFSKKMSRLSKEKTSLKKSIFSICPNEEIVKDNSKAGSFFDFVKCTKN